MIDVDDIERLCAELAGGVLSPEPWMERTGFTVQAMGHLVKSVTTAIALDVADGMDIADSLTNSLAVLFQLGWEAHRQYGVPQEGFEEVCS